jgi:alpha-amylase/alpha-mannosidase (GH57 family)
MKYVAIFHANLNYAYLTPEKYEFVIRNSYELIFDTMLEVFPGTKFVFEASGYTIEQMVSRTPDVMEKLIHAVRGGQCEFMGSPYAHPMLPNFPPRDGAKTLEFSNRVYEKHLGMIPESFWNPECGWREYVGPMIRDAGYKYFVGDFESYSRSLGKDGRPQRPEIHSVEATKEKNFYSFGFKYDLGGDDPALHYPFHRIDGLDEDDLRVFLRSDRICQYAVRYFMGMEGYSHAEYLETILKYSKPTAGRQEGALVLFADDAEYVGTNGWFKLKYQNQPDRIFERVDGARQKLVGLVQSVQEFGEFITFKEACRLEPNPEPINWDEDSAWHGAQASVWASTPMARLLRPWQDLVREKLEKIETSLSPVVRDQAWYYLTNSYNSDGQWPPTLPDAPHIIHPFNYGYCFENLLSAHLLVGGVDLTGNFTLDAAEALEEVLGMQAELIRNKASRLQKADCAETVRKSELALCLIALALENESLIGESILNADHYAVRAKALTQARELVGGVTIEKVLA